MACPAGDTEDEGSDYQQLEEDLTIIDDIRAEAQDTIAPLPTDEEVDPYTNPASQTENHRPLPAAFYRSQSSGSAYLRRDSSYDVATGTYHQRRRRVTKRAFRIAVSSYI